MYIGRRSRKKQRKRVFFLLLAAALFITPFIIAFSLGASQLPNEFTFHPGAQRPERQVIVTISSEKSMAVQLFIPSDPRDSWSKVDSQLELYLYDPHAIAAFSPEIDWIDQHIKQRLESNRVVYIFNLDNLPPIFRLLRTDFGYRIEWTDGGLDGKRIAIDPGHGGHDPGAIGHRLKLKEKDVVLAIGLELQRLLEAAGAEVFMTRSTDTLVDTNLKVGQHIRPDLWMRRNIVHEWSPDFFISIHNNSWSAINASGIETYYNRYALNGPLGRVAAQLVQDRLVFEFLRRDRGIKYKESSDAVLNLDDFPAILAEILFISNPAEERIMAEPDFAQRAANALFLGIQDYFNLIGGESR